jgi:arginase
MGPAALRTVDIAGTLEALGHKLVDRGDVSAKVLGSGGCAAPANARNFGEIAAFAKAISAETFDALRQGQFPIVLGGDHSLAMGSVNGVARHCAENARELFILWLDAHADFNTPETSPSGDMHGMSLAMLAGEAGLDAVLEDEYELKQHAGTLKRKLDVLVETAMP